MTTSYAVTQWILAVPLSFRLSLDQRSRLRAYMLDRHPGHDFEVMTAPWTTGEVTVLPIRNRRGDREPFTMLEEPSVETLEAMNQACREFEAHKVGQLTSC